MPRLQVFLLGSFQVRLDGEPVAGLATDKVRALLAYLAAEASRPHRREKLAALLWPEQPDHAAQTSLRSALSRLRAAIGDREATSPFLDVTRQTVQFSAGSDAWVDAQEFDRLLGGGRIRSQPIQLLETAVEQVRGEFMEGFGLGDSEAFEDWLLHEREQVARLRLEALHRLTTYHQTRGSFDTALRYAWQLVEIEPYDEEAQRGLLYLLAVTGQRTTALARYGTLRQLLKDELAAEPSAGTQALYRKILSGEIEPQQAAQRDRTIRGYDLLEQIGRGTSGAVYRAYQPVLGRQVAVKVILPEFANQPGFIRRFEAEAQMVARLEHPYIVPLYDYWREPDGAYLVMRLCTAGSLQECLSQGPWQPEAVARLVEQVSSALDAAHSQGVIHRDVKPANILLDQARNAYLSDFSIAREMSGSKTGPTPDMLTVSPWYAAPEQWEGVSLTPAVDVYSLGVVLYELLAGSHPFAACSSEQLHQRHLCEPLPPLSSARQGLPPAVDKVIGRATAKTPRERYSGALAFSGALCDALEPGPGHLVSGVEIPRPEPQNPYRGLRPFEEADSQRFFGRESLVQDLVGRLVQPSTWQPGSRFLAVVGPSGSGKSSLIKAGLIPALRNGAVPGSENWYYATMHPGIAPLDELAAALLAVSVRSVRGLPETLGSDEKGLVRAVEMVLPEADTDSYRVPGAAAHCRLCLVVDQFEELYAPSVERSQRDRFLHMLHVAATEPASPLCVVITLRADFYDRPLRHPGLSQLLRHRTSLVVPLSSEELASAIRGPAGQVGVDLEDGLLEAILVDVADEPGALPMFQYALTELFEHRRGRLLTWEAYHAIGGVSGALARRAEAVYMGLDPTEQAAARQIFLRLATPGEGVENTRRRVHLSELQALRTQPAPTSPVAGASPALAENAANPVLDAFGRARLLLFDRDPATRAPTVEVAHEALLSEWRRLAGWLEEAQADIRMERLLSIATDEWLEAGRDSGFLLRGTRLAQFEGWAEAGRMALTREERSFLDASVEARRQRRLERDAQRQRELEAARALSLEQSRRAEVEQKRAEEQARTAHRLRRWAFYLAGALLLAVLLAITAGLFGQQASRNAGVAETREAEALANALQAATSAADARKNADLAVTRQADAVAHAEEAATSAAVARSNANLAATREAEAVAEADLRATAQAEVARKQRAAEEQARLATSRELAAAAVSPLAANSELGALLALHALAQAATLEAENALRQTISSLRLLYSFTGHSAPIADVAVSPNGALLATASPADGIRLWDMGTGRELQVLQPPGGATCVTFAPSGAELAACGGDGVVHFWQLTTSVPFPAQETQTFAAGPGPLGDLAFSSSGGHLAVAGTDGSIQVLEAATGKHVLTLTGHKAGRSPSRPWAAGVSDLHFSPDAARLASAGFDGTSKVWDVETGKQVVSLSGLADAISSAEFSPDGTRLITASQKTRAKLWDITSGQAALELAIDLETQGIAYCPDGACLALLDADGFTHLWDLESGEEILTLPRHPGAWVLAFTPEGARVVTAGEDGVARLWDASPSSEVLALTGTGAGVAFSPEGARLVTGVPGGALVWDISPRPGQALQARAAGALDRKLTTMDGHSGGVSNVAFSPDGALVATAGIDGSARLWDAATGQEHLALAAHTARVWDVAFSPDGARLATAGGDTTAKVWDILSGTEQLALTGHTDAVCGIAFGSGGDQLATGGRDGTVRLWDAQTGREAYRISVGSQVLDVDLAPGGELLAAADVDGVTRVWDLRSQAPRLSLTLGGHKSAVTRVAFNHDGSRLATASLDRVVKIWDTDSGEELLTLALHEAGLTGVAFSPNGAYLATSGGGITRIYALGLQELVAIARSRLTRSLTEEECRLYLHLDQCPP